MKTKQFMALLKKDLLIYKNILLLPIWITLGFYLINLVSFAFAYFRGDISHFIHFSEGDFSFAINNVNNPIISYIANYGAVLVPAVLSGIVLIYLAQKAMNEDKNLQFSFFHRSQPVDESLIIASKSVIIIVGLWLTTAVLSLLNFTIVNIVLHTKLHLFHSQGMIGFFQSLFLVLLSFFFVGSSLILCSSIFKKAAFMKLFSVLILIKFLFGIFEYLYRWDFPNIFSRMLNPIAIPFNYLFTIELRYMNLNDVIEHVNNNIFSVNTAVILFFSFTFLIATYYVYKNSEIAG